jgi:hypothetical protein
LKMNNYQIHYQQSNAQQQQYYPQQQHLQQQYNVQQPSAQPTVIIVKNRSSNKSLMAGTYGCCVSLFCTPLISLCALFCIKNPRHRALIILTSGIGGLAWLLVFFPIGAIYQSIGSYGSSYGYGTCWEPSYGDSSYYPYYNGTSFYNGTYAASYGYGYDYDTSTSSPGYSPGYDCGSYYDYGHGGFQGVAIAMFVLGGLFTILDIVLICMGSIQINRVKSQSKIGPSSSDVSVQVIQQYQQQNHHQPMQMNQLPPPYSVPAGAVAVPMAGGSGSNGSRLSLESMAVHLNIPGLLNVSLADALEMDFKRLKESCGITEEEYLRLKRYKSSTQ